MVMDPRFLLEPRYLTLVESAKALPNSLVRLWMCGEPLCEKNKRDLGKRSKWLLEASSVDISLERVGVEAGKVVCGC